MEAILLVLRTGMQSPADLPIDLGSSLRFWKGCKKYSSLDPGWKLTHVCPAVRRVFVPREETVGPDSALGPTSCLNLSEAISIKPTTDRKTLVGLRRARRVNG